MALSRSDPSPRREVGDDDLLAAVHTCGSAADLASLRECVREHTGLYLNASYLADRLDRLHRAGYVRRFQPHETEVPRYRLTELGVERLDQPDTESPAGSIG